ncbi:MAG TPA: prepilin-type N-terminal cleavage/methylation domain-containing protein [Rariglobus sp.]
MNTASQPTVPSRHAKAAVLSSRGVLSTPVVSVHHDRRSSPQSRPTGFTLTELLVCIAIIGILAALIIPIVGMVKGKAMTAQCSSNLRQCATAINLYAAEHKGWAPKTTWTLEIQSYLTPMTNKAGTSYTNAAIKFPISCPSLPYDDELYGRSTYSLNSDLDVDGKSENVDPVTGKTSYAWFMHLPSVGTPSRTIMLFDGILNSTASQWATSCATGTGQTDFRHPGDVANFVFLDGHVRALRKEEITSSMWKRNDGSQ